MQRRVKPSRPCIGDGKPSDSIRRTIESHRKTGLSPLIWQTRVGRSQLGLQTGSDDALYSIEQGESLKSIVSRRGDEKVNTILRDKDIEDFRVCPKGQKVLVTRRNTVGGTYRVDDLYLLDRATDEMSRITRGARIREIDCGPHGRFAYGAQIHEGGTRLVRVALRTGDIEVLYAPEALGQVSHPSISPDGLFLVFEVTGTLFAVTL